jgi:hypothetical protein
MIENFMLIKSLEKAIAAYHAYEAIESSEGENEAEYLLHCSQVEPLKKDADSG